jgi:signal transduction histidine kinase
MSPQDPHRGPDPEEGQRPAGRAEYSQANLAPTKEFSTFLALCARRFFDADDLPTLSETFLAGLLAREGLGARLAAIFLLDEDRARLRGYHAASRGPAGPVSWRGQAAGGAAWDLETPAARQVRGMTVDLQGDAAHVEALQEGRPIWVSRSDAEVRLDATLRELAGPLDLAVCPLAGRGGPTGLCAVALEPCDPEERPRFLHVLEAASGLFADALFLQRSESALARQRQFLQTIHQAAQSRLGSHRLDHMLRAVAHGCVQRLGAGSAAIWVREGETLRLLASGGVSTTGPLEPFESFLPLVEQAMHNRASIRRGPGSAGDPAALCVPMLAQEEAVGAIALLRRLSDDGSHPAPFTAEDQSFAEIMGALGASAVQSARLSSEVRTSGRRVHQAERSLVQVEKLAALGEMSAKVAHEIRNPLSAIGGFARRIEKGLAEGDPNRAYASIILREITRLEVLLNEQLEFATDRRSRMTMVDVGGLIRETVLLVREEVERNGAQLLDQSPGGLPKVLLDRDQVKQVLLNILKNAAQCTRRGHRIRIRTRVSEGWIQIEIANDGERMPGEILENLFVPFATARSGGLGLGLAVADQIVREHGGEIRVRAGDEWSVVFTVSLPVRTNADRRQRSNRRTGRDRRRAA